jgi:hypothetical protein
MLQAAALIRLYKKKIYIYTFLQCTQDPNHRQQTTTSPCYGQHVYEKKQKIKNAFLHCAQDPSSQAADYNEPMLRAAALKGIKKTGLVYSPGKSWVAGICLMVVGILIFAITIVTAFDD